MIWLLECLNSHIVYRGMWLPHFLFHSPLYALPPFYFENLRYPAPYYKPSEKIGISPFKNWGTHYVLKRENQGKPKSITKLFYETHKNAFSHFFLGWIQNRCQLINLTCRTTTWIGWQTCTRYSHCHVERSRTSSSRAHLSGCKDRMILTNLYMIIRFGDGWEFL